MTNRADVRLANEAWESVMTTHAHLTRGFAAEGMWGEISMREYDVLYTLAKAGGPLRLSELQNGVLLSQPALSRMVDRLVERGLLSRCSDDEDRRAVRIWLTEGGTELQRQVGRAHAKSVAKAMTALTADELGALRSLMQKLTERCGS